MMATEAERHAAITEADVKRMREWMLEFDVPLYVVTQTIYYAFIRPVELSRLQGRHLDLKNRVILMDSAISKNKKSQHVTIPGPLLEIFKRYGFDQAEPNDYLFGKGVWLSRWSSHPNRYRTRHLEMVKALGLAGSGVDLYSWKHTGVCAAYRAGLDIVSIKEQCRHSSIEETYTYMRSLGLILSREIMEKEW